jgi:phosphatidylglycerol:prolipoprotein diacylglycerol transferase
LRVASILSLDVEKIGNLALVGVVVTLCTAKLLSVVSNWPRMGTNALMLGLNGGGDFLFAGIAVGGAICWMYAHHLRMPLRRAADAFAPSLAAGSSVASLACFEAGCNYGTPTRLPWAIAYTSPWVAPLTPVGVWLHPVQIYFSLMEFGLFVFLLWLLRRQHRDGDVIAAWLFGWGLGRYLLAFLQGNNHGVFLGDTLSIVQIVAIAMVLLGAILWIQPAHRDGVQLAG